MNRTTAAPVAKARRGDKSPVKGKVPDVRGVRVSVAEARRNFDALLEQVSTGRLRVVIERAGKVVGFLGTSRDLAVVVEEEEDREDIAAAKRALAEADEKGTVPWERVKAGLGL